MSEHTSISPEEVFKNFLDSVEITIECEFPFIMENKELYFTWSDTLDFIMANYPNLAERAQHLAQYLDTLFHGNPFTE